MITDHDQFLLLIILLIIVLLYFPSNETFDEKVEKKTYKYHLFSNSYELFKYLVL